MDVFRDAWIHQVKVLTEAVDDITTIDDFLAVSGMLLQLYITSSRDLLQVLNISRILHLVQILEISFFLQRISTICDCREMSRGDRG